MANSKAIEAGGAFVRLFTDKSPMVRGLKDARATFDNWATGIGSAGAKLLGAGAAGFTGGAVAVKQFADMGSALNDMSVRTGVSVEELSGLKYAAEQNGSSLEALEGGLKKYSKTAVAATQGNKEALDAFRTLGISITELNGMSAEDQLELIGNQLNKIPEGARRSAAAMGIFGKSGADLIPVLTDLRANMDRAKELGLGWTTEEASNADALGDRLDDLKSVALRTVQVIGSALAPTVMELSEPLLNAAVATREWIDENPGVIQTVAMVTAGVAGLGVALLGTAGVISVTASAMGVASSAWMAMGAVIASPIALPAALLGLGYVVTTQTDIGKNAVKGLRDTFPGVSSAVDAVAARASEGFSVIADAAKEVGTTAVTTWGGITDAVAAGDLELAGQVAMAGLTAVWYVGTQGIKDTWYTGVAYVESVWNDFTSGIASTWIETTALIETTAENMYAFFSSMWVDVKGMALDAFDGIVQAWDSSAGWIADKIIDIGVATGVIDNSAADEMKANRADATNSRSTDRVKDGETRDYNQTKEQAGIQSTLEQNRAAYEKKRQHDLAVNEAEQEKRRAEIETARNDAITASEKAKNDSLDALAKMREKAAKTKAEADEKKKPKDKKPAPDGGDIPDDKPASGSGGQNSAATVSGIVSSLNRGGGASSPEQQKKDEVDKTTDAVARQTSAYDALTKAINEAREAAVNGATDAGKTAEEQTVAGNIAAEKARREFVAQQPNQQPAGQPAAPVSIAEQRKRQAEAQMQAIEERRLAAGIRQEQLRRKAIDKATGGKVRNVPPKPDEFGAQTAAATTNAMPEMPSAMTLDSIRTMVASIRIPDISAISSPSTARTESTFNAQAIDLEPLLYELKKLNSTVEHGGTLTA